MEDTGAPDLESLERVLCRLPAVTTARVVAGPDGGIAEVHILSLPDKPAKQVVRDVQSAALAMMGIDVDRRVVSVVQLDAPGPDSPPPPSSNGRVCLEEVRSCRGGVRCQVEVVLSQAHRRMVGTAEGVAAASNMLRLAAQATMAALGQFETAAARADVEAATIVGLGQHSVALTTLVVVVPPYEEIISGSAVVRAGAEMDAVARSVLDATNRRLARLR